MGLADELRKLQELRDAGTLSDAEFAQAKAALLKNPPAESPSPELDSRPRDALGNAAQTWVTFQIVMAVIGLIVGAIFFFGFWLPQWNRMGGP